MKYRRTNKIQRHKKTYKKQNQRSKLIDRKTSFWTILHTKTLIFPLFHVKHSVFCFATAFFIKSLFIKYCFTWNNGQIIDYEPQSHNLVFLTLCNPSNKVLVIIEQTKDLVFQCFTWNNLKMPYIENLKRAFVSHKVYLCLILTKGVKKEKSLNVGLITYFTAWFL